MLVMILIVALIRWRYDLNHSTNIHWKFIRTCTKN